VLASAAGRLSVNRAQLVLASFALTSQNVETIARICRRLDGIPLALELAAAHLTTLNVDQIADHLNQRFRLLTGGSRTAVRRQQTLQATIDWGYELLTEQEPTLLRGVAVFAGGWSLEAAEALAEAVHIPASGVLDLLSRLVAKSLAVADEQPGVKPNVLRYWLLETIREYAEQKLIEAHELSLLRDYHRDYFLSWAQRHPPGSHSSGPPQRITGLRSE
jgi:predicted ATPase